MNVLVSMLRVRKSQLEFIVALAVSCLPFACGGPSFPPLEKILEVTAQFDSVTKFGMERGLGDVDVRSNGGVEGVNRHILKSATEFIMCLST